MFTDNFFKKVENKTNVNKNTILNLANKLSNSNMKDEKTIREVIKNISELTSKEKEEKIVNAILKDKVPKNVDKMF